MIGDPDAPDPMHLKIHRMQTEMMRKPGAFFDARISGQTGAQINNYV